MNKGLLSFCISTLIFLTDCSVSHKSSSKEQEEKNEYLLEHSKVGPLADSSFLVATTQVIDPAGETITFPGRPTDISVNLSEKTLAIKNMESIDFVDVEHKKIIQTLKIPQGGNTFSGIAWSGEGNDEKVWTTDTEGYLRSAKINSNGRYDWADQFLLPALVKKDANGLDPGGLTKIDKKSVYPGGFAIDEASGLIYVALNRNNSVCVVNMKTGAIVGQVPVGVAPFTVLLHKDKAYVTNQGGRIPVAGDKTALSSGTSIVIDPGTGIASTGTVSVIDLHDHKVISEINVRLHPTAMALAADGNTLFVANSNSDLISVIDTRTYGVIKTFSCKPYNDLPLGSSPTALSLSPDGKKLYIANGGNNALAVFDTGKDTVTGMIPAGWYPGAVSLNRAGTQLIVANIKGVGGRDLDPGKKGYNSHDHLGSVSFIPVPDDKLLQAYTEKAITNMNLPKIYRALKQPAGQARMVPVPTRAGEKSVFKHVLYIIRENRTYDQVFGDIAKGNGDSSLCLFGKSVTPNAHALANEFVLLDNTYCNGVNSADGHQWTDEGLATGYLERSYGGFVRSYPCCGGEDPLAYASSGFIWNNVLQHNLTFRNYGEMVQAKITPENATWTDIYNDFISKTNSIKVEATAELAMLRPYLSPNFIGFPQVVPDIYRANEFIKELKGYEQRGDLPNFMIMLLPNDHTAAANEKFPTPRAMVADNDLALGQIVEAVSKSRFWKETAIFVIEDDAQAGLDHVDGRRTVSLCISPYTRRNAVVSTMYNHNSILRTTELIFGLPPMNQFDLVATPLIDCFTDKPNFTPFTALPNQIPLNEMNPKITQLKGKQKYWAKESMKIPLGDVDLGDMEVFSRVSWYSVKGYSSTYPKK
ncbi:bifunctional YncE family protein/alkaline phosphatase family protein [Flavihumibacter profundi]|uniref:bifunctional YncE family protein/alkaline phosphatase family protein n=1 Tax=Flavihumibacter profundi TaxID=2716883 RepID=UPI001CC44F35|nr:bifunctional YncE family protein/alkaline phosphatase family protein [Flavihumibacter profundi]MBZ5857601.1 bifunctional YncE family protein/alkaline phosphatase family protein [Flavihumibacter profundi]